jgi:hypothetical protein
VDNNGIIFKGTIGQATEDTASFTLEGMTTIGAEATISGSISVPVGGSEGTMRGTWIEPTLFSSVYGEATVPTNEQPTDGTDTNGTDNGTSPGTNTTGSLSIEPSGTISLQVGGVTTFTASGGTGSYSWDYDTSLGLLSPTEGPTVSYLAVVPGTQTVTVSSGGDSASTTIEQSQ